MIQLRSHQLSLPLESDEKQRLTPWCFFSQEDEA
jgi:hypothetical protein